MKVFIGVKLEEPIIDFCMNFWAVNSHNSNDFLLYLQLLEELLEKLFLIL